MTDKPPTDTEEEVAFRDFMGLVAVTFRQLAVEHCHEIGGIRCHS